MNIYEIDVTNKNNQLINLDKYKNAVLLIVNTATGCGFTPQYKGLQELYDKYKERGFYVLDFPSNQFGNQAPGSDHDIEAFCTTNYGTTFPRFSKIDVNGKNTAPLFKYLKKEKGSLLGSSIKWNFTKFLVDKNGIVIKRYGPKVIPEKIEADIISLL